MIMIGAALIVLATVISAVFSGLIPAVTVFVTGLVLLAVFLLYTRNKYLQDDFDSKISEGINFRR